MPALVNVGSVTMPAGEYWVGDPCYAFKDHERWMVWLTEAGIDEQPIPRYMVGDVDGRTAVGVGTAHGDGVYYGTDGNEYGVDAGMIGAVPVEVAEDNALYAMHKVNFANPFEVTYENGCITIGHIEIDTGDDAWP